MRGARGWTIHILCAIAILFFLTLHMITMHFDDVLGIFNPAGGAAIDWANVMGRGKSVLLMLAYLGLLGTALYHGLYGLRNILFELNLSTKTEKALTGLFWLMGTGLFFIGTYAAIASHLFATKAA